MGEASARACTPSPARMPSPAPGKAAAGPNPSVPGGAYWRAILGTCARMRAGEGAPIRAPMHAGTHISSPSRTPPGRHGGPTSRGAGRAGQRKNTRAKRDLYESSGQLTTHTTHSCPGATGADHAEELAVLDEDRSPAARSLLAAYRAADYFHIDYDVTSESELRKLIDETAHAVFGVLGFVMKAAPFGAHSHLWQLPV